MFDVGQPAVVRTDGGAVIRNRPLQAGNRVGLAGGAVILPQCAGAKVVLPFGTILVFKTGPNFRLN